MRMLDQISVESIFFFLLAFGIKIKLYNYLLLKYEWEDSNKNHMYKCLFMVMPSEKFFGIKSSKVTSVRNRMLVGFKFERLNYRLFVWREWCWVFYR